MTLHSLQNVQVKKSNGPHALHVAMIMDGNGRWARQRGLPHLAGHRQGAEALRSVLEVAHSIGIDYLTVYGFSSENWGRPAHEVSGLMQLLRVYLERESAKLHEAGLRFRVIGDRSRLDQKIIAMIAAIEERTARNSKLNFTVAISYGGRADILQAARSLAQQAAEGRLDPGMIDENLFSSHLATSNIPDPDLLIRTSGELRISNFLLWQSAYTELAFSDKLWPDFNGDDLQAIVAEFRERDRRFGC